MALLGWGLGKWKAEYKTSLPRLSDEEARLVLSVAEGFRTENQSREISDDKDARQRIENLLLETCEEQGLQLDFGQEKYISNAVFMQTAGAGFLDELLADPALEEIAVIGLGKPVFVFVRGKGWKKTGIFIDSQEYFVSLANRLGRDLGRRLTAQHPRLNAVLPDGSRLHASMPPISSCELTIRKFTSEPISAFDLLSLGTYNAKALSILSLAIQSDFSIVLAGNTASGKTSTLNALLSFVPSSERLLLVEETPEISTPHIHQLRLLPFEEGEIGMVELVRDSLRMRPDRVVVGEVRCQDEARAFVESALSGQAKGCYATFHAQSARDALLRLRMMGCLEADLGGIDLFVVQRRVSTYDSKERKIGEARKLTEISLADKQSPLNPKILFDGKSFSRQVLNIFVEKISSNSGMPKSEVHNELISREKFLLKNRGAKGFEKSFGILQKFLFGGGAIA